MALRYRVWFTRSVIPLRTGLLRKPRGDKWLVTLAVLRHAAVLNEVKDHLPHSFAKNRYQPSFLTGAITFMFERKSQGNQPLSKRNRLSQLINRGLKILLYILHQILCYEVGEAIRFQLALSSCTFCGNPLKEQFSVCPFCHTLLKKNCVSCGTMVNLNWIYCPLCGAKNK